MATPLYMPNICLNLVQPDAQEQQETNTTNDHLQVSVIQELSLMNFRDLWEDYEMNFPLDQIWKLSDAFCDKRKHAFVVAALDDTHHIPTESNSEQFLRLIRNLSDGGLKILREPNAGGNSLFSEVLSFEVMNRFFGAKLDKTEMEIQYYPTNSKKVDYSVSINGEKVGVSVTRAFHYVNDALFTERDAHRLLTKKLDGLNIATSNVSKEDRWTKQILHIWVKSLSVAQTLYEQYLQLPDEVRQNTVVLVTMSSQYDCVFTERSSDVKEVFEALDLGEPVVMPDDDEDDADATPEDSGIVDLSYLDNLDFDQMMDDSYSDHSDDDDQFLSTMSF